MASSVTRRTVVSYTAFPPLPQCCQAASSGISLLHYPWSRLHRTLSGILPYEARTFLTCFYKQPRSSVLLAPCYSSTPHLFCQTVHSAPFAKPRFQRSPLLRSSFLLMKWRSLRTFMQADFHASMKSAHKNVRVNCNAHSIQYSWGSGLP